MKTSRLDRRFSDIKWSLNYESHSLVKFYVIWSVALMVSSLILGCARSGDTAAESLQQIILALDTDQKKSNYLTEILEDDQRVRAADDGALLLQYGAQSAEYREYVRTQIEMDQVNLTKVEAYLDAHDYPSTALGEAANTAPWIVIHHSQGYESRLRNFPHIYRAYIDGLLDEGAMAMYLGRMHHMRYGKMLRMEGAYRAEDQIDTLIQLLELEDLRSEVE